MRHELLPRAVMALFMGITFILVAGALESVNNLILRVAPASYWFEYESVEPLHTNFDIGETLQFVSKFERYRPVNFTFNDTLYCDNGNGFAYYSNYVSSSIRNMPKKDISIWNYNAIYPQQKSTCKLRSVITHTIDRGYKKSQEIDGPEFTIGY